MGHRKEFLSRRFCSDEGLTLETSALANLPSTRLIKPNYLVILSHRRSTTVSLETYPFIKRDWWVVVRSTGFPTSVSGSEAHWQVLSSSIDKHLAAKLKLPGVQILQGCGIFFSCPTMLKPFYFIFIFLSCPAVLTSQFLIHLLYKNVLLFLCLSHY